MNETINCWPKRAPSASQGYDPLSHSSVGALSDQEFEVLLDWHKEWKKSLPDYSFSQALNIFPEALPAAKRNLQEKLKQIKKKLSDLDDERQSYIERVINPAHFSKQNELTEDLNERMERWTKQLEDEKKSIERKLYGISLKKNPKAETSGHLDIERAKQVPIDEIIKPNRAGFVRCPFHSDKNPSMKLYKYHAYCFAGCGKKDGIDIVMAVHGLDFRKAVEFLMKV